MLPHGVIVNLFCIGSIFTKVEKGKMAQSSVFCTVLYNSELCTYLNSTKSDPVLVVWMYVL